MKPICLLLLLSFAGCERETPFSKINLPLKGIDFKIEIAETPSQQSQGLMYRESLGKNEGMLFVFKKDQRLHFWMKNTTIPLSIAYIGSEGIIKEIKTMAPLSEETVSSSVPVRYALELRQGRFRELDLKEGDKILLPEDL